MVVQGETHVALGTFSFLSGCSLDNILAMCDLLHHICPKSWFWDLVGLLVSLCGSLAKALWFCCNI